MNAIPAKIGKYEIIRKIGESNDIVYEGFDPVINRRVAIKVLNVSATSPDAPQRKERFQREARAAGALDHPNLMRIYDAGEESGVPYIAMEFLTGRSLRQELEHVGFMNEDRAVKIVLDVLKGLSYAHSKGVLHRDIKPDNIQILTDGTIKITDFGIARVSFEPALTQGPQVWGTPGYIAPEVMDGLPFDERSDIFSAGVTLFVLVSGTKPFDGFSALQRPAQASDALWPVLKKCLEKSPDDRFQSADEVIAALKVVLSSSRQKAAAPRPAQNVVAANKIQQINQNPAQPRPVPRQAAQAPAPQAVAKQQVVLAPQPNVRRHESQFPWSAVVWIGVIGLFFFGAAQCMNSLGSLRPSPGQAESGPSSTPTQFEPEPDSSTFEVVNEDQSQDLNVDDSVDSQEGESRGNEITIIDPSRARVVPESLDEEDTRPPNSRVLKFGEDGS